MATHTAQNHSVAYSKHFLACCLKTSVRTAQNRRLGTAKHCSGPLKTSSRQLQDDFGTTSAASGPPDRKTALNRTTQNQLGKAAPGSPGRKTLFRTAQNQLQASSRHRSAPLKTSSGPARDQLKHQRSSHQLELCMECTGHLCKRHRSPCNLQGRIPPQRRTTALLYLQLSAEQGLCCAAL